MFCERCGLQFLPQQSVCSRCGLAPTQHWLQLVGLVTLAVTMACNALVSMLLLPRLVDGQHAPAVFRGWLWFSDKFSSYGWVAFAVALLVWSFWLRRGHKLQKKEWLARLVLLLLLLGGFMALLLRWVPARVLRVIPAAISRHSGSAAAVPWGVIALVAGVLCLNVETRDSLLGDGKVLSLVSVGLLLLLLTMILLAWFATIP